MIPKFATKHGESYPDLEINCKLSRTASLSPCLLLIVLLLVSYNAKGQSLYYTFDAGATLNFIKQPTYTTTDIKQIRKIGYSAALLVHAHSKKGYTIGCGIIFSEKNYRSNRTGRFEAIYDEQRNGYLNIPLLLGYEINTKRVSVSINAGGFAGYWLYSKSKGVVPNIFSIQDSISPISGAIQFFSISSYNENNRFNDEHRRFEAGIISELRVEYPFNSSFRPFISLRLLNSITNQLKHSSTSGICRKNNQLTLTIGVVFGCATV